ncbi:MAG: hypothetical protein WBP72_03430 [Rhodocyclaceae bacterium]
MVLPLSDIPGTPLSMCASAHVCVVTQRASGTDNADGHGLVQQGGQAPANRRADEDELRH